MPPIYVKNERLNYKREPNFFNPVKAPFGTWTPAQLADTEVWLSAKNTNSITLSSGVVSQWSDLSGNNNHAIQNSATCRPTYTSGQYVEFDGIDNGLIVTTYTKSSRTANPKLSIFAVIEPILESTPKAVASFDATTGGYNRGIATSSSWGVEVQGGGSTNNMRASLSAGFSVVGAIYDYSSNYYLALNGNITAKGSGESGAGNTGNTLSVGFGYPSSSTTGNAQNFKGKISEFLVIRGDTTTDTTNKVLGYLHHNWNLAGLLPSNHPYKAAPPPLT